MKKQNTEVYLKPAIKTDVHSIGIPMSPEASKNIAGKQVHAHMCCEAELGPEPRTPGEWHGGGAVEDVGRPCFPRRWRKCAIPGLRPFSEQLGTPLRKSQLLGMC